MKIGIDTLSQTPNGTGGLTFIKSLIKHLAILNCENQLYVFTSKTSRHILDTQNSKVHFVDSCYSNEIPVLRILSQLIQIPYLSAKLNLDVILFPANVGPLISKIPVVLIIQNRLQYDMPKNYGFFKKLFNNIFGKIALCRAERIICVSHDLANYVANKFKALKLNIEVIYEGVDPPISNNRDKNSSNIFQREYGSYILNVGNLWPHKNHEELLKSYEYCVTKYGISQQLLIVGKSFSDDYSQYLLTLCSNLNINNRVHFLDYVPSEEMYLVYSGADVVVQPSLFESFCLPIVEAMAFEVPLVVSNRTALPEIAGDAALVVDPTDVESFAKALIEIINNQDLRRSLVKRGRYRARQLTWRKCAKDVQEVLCKVKSGRSI